MESDINPLLYIGLLFILILANAFFAMSETAVISLNDNKLRKQAADGDKKAQMILSLLNEPTNFLATVQIGTTLAGFMASAVAADTFVAYILAIMRRSIFAEYFAPPFARVVILIMVTLILTYLSLIFGELVPKRIAMQNYESIALSVATPLSIIYKMSKPFVILLSKSVNVMLRLMGINPNEKPEEVTEEEIRMMIDVGSEDGNIPESDADMLNNIFDFADTPVEEIMTPRTEVETISVDATLPEVMELCISTGYSRIPVYGRDIDSIEGILYVKDLLELVVKSKDTFVLRDYLREPMFVFESQSCKNLLETLKQKKLQMAIVVDEYGGTSGIITMEDLLEAIVGNIQDEYDDEPEEIMEVSSGVYIIDGMTPYEDVAEFLGLNWSGDEADYDTLGGHILSLIGHIPNEDEKPSVKVEHVLFTVTEMDERRVSKVRAERLKTEDEATDESEKQ